MDDFISIPDGDYLNINNDYTWLVSGKILNSDIPHMIFSNNTYYNTDGYYIHYLPDRRIWFSLCSDGTCYQYSSDPDQIEEGEWFSLAITKNNGSIKLFLNSNDITDQSYNITPEEDITQYYIDPDAPLRIGISGDNQQPFYGNLDAISLWNTALDQSEIQSYMSTPVSYTHLTLPTIYSV